MSGEAVERYRAAAAINAPLSLSIPRTPSGRTISGGWKSG
jgi:hypothetical protein